jgi:hypothetical protein
MEPLYLGPRYWPITPPLDTLQAQGTQVGILLSAPDFTPENTQLLEKILAAVRWSFSDATLFRAHIPLSWGRLALLPYPYLWVFGKTLLPVPVGVYDVSSGQKLVQLPPQKAGLVWRLPTLTEMQNNTSAKHEAWQWLKLLTLRS